MAKAVYYPKGERQKTIIKLLNSLEGRYSRWDIWQDFIVLSAVSIANAFGGPYREQREAMYLERSKKYSTSELEVLAQMLAEVVDEMEQNPDQDMLGELFMALGLANEWKGQFFTPYDICRAMAAMNLGEDLKSQIEEKGWVSVSDPACGAGALLLAFANECKRNHINYQTSVFFVAQDIDFLAGCMCYIQMSLLGCPGYVVIDDSILHPAQSYDEDGLIPKNSPNVWLTPMYFRDVWHSFLIMFAWSVWSCMIDGYPQRNDAECITLSEACMEDHVAVEIRSTETGMCFEEHVTCDEDGNLNHAERDLNRCKCRNCGEISYFGSFENLDDAECSECGECGFDRCEEE